VRANFLGLIPFDEKPDGNAGYGLALEGSDSNTIGGADPSSRNVIGGNAAGVHLDGAGNLVEGNVIGANSVFTSGLGFGNHGDGLDVVSGANQVVGNTISGNGGIGVFSINGTLTLQGNLIGTDDSGEVGVGNRNNGVVFNSTRGGVIEGNVISDNLQGVRIVNDLGGVVVLGNFIGSDATGAADLGNHQEGVYLDNASDDLIGGFAPGDGNVIAFNAKAGVAVVGSSIRDLIVGNSIFDNHGIGIDPGDDGVTPNDGHVDNGPNRGLDAPVLNSANTQGGVLTVTGTLALGLPNTRVFVAVYSSPDAEVNATHEGRTYLGTVSVVTDATGHATFTFTAPAEFFGRHVTATAIDDRGDTSEFSQAVPITVSAVPPIHHVPLPGTTPAGDGKAGSPARMLASAEGLAFMEFEWLLASQAAPSQGWSMNHESPVVDLLWLNPELIGLLDRAFPG
jgi:hypothetical protein